MLKEQVNEMCKELKQACIEIGKKYNINIQVDFDFIENGIIQMEENFKKYANKYNLKAEDLGKPIKIGRRLFKIVGLALQAKKKKIIIQGKRGGLYRVEPIEVERSLHLFKE